MRKVNFSALLIVSSLLIFFPHVTHSQQDPEIFGYWANNAIQENEDHTTVTVIWAGYADRSVATNEILSQLASAQSYGIKAIVPLDPFLFSPGGVGSGGEMECNYSAESQAATYFSDLVDELISEGYLVSNDPDASTVIAFSPVDEPELCGLGDQGGNPHPALASAVQVVNNNPHTSNFPVYVNVHNFNQVINGIHLFDWASMDDYNKSTSQYLSHFSNFVNALLLSQDAILLPQASFGGSLMGSYGMWHDPYQIFDRMLSDDRIIGIIPFLWSHADTDGTRDIPELRDAYENIGGQIKDGKPISLELFCNPHFQPYHYRCTALVEGGWDPIGAQWDSICQPNGLIAVCDVGCRSAGGPVLSKEVDVLVTDDLGYFRETSKLLEVPICDQDPD